MFRRFVNLEDFLLKWGLAAILIALPLYPKFPLFNVPGTYVAIRVEDFLITALAFFFFFHIARNLRAFLSDKINQAIVLFILVGALSLVSGVVLTHTVVPHLGFLHWARRIEYFIPFFVGVSYARETRNVAFFAEALFVATIFVFLYGLGQVHLGFPVISTQSEEFSKGIALRWVPDARLHSTFAGHYDLGAYLVLVLPLAFAFLLTHKSWSGRILVLLVIGAAFWLLLASSSRISVAAYFLGVGITLWLLRQRFFIIPVFLVSFLFVLTTGDLTARYRYTLEATASRLHPLMSVVNPLKSQFQDWKEGLVVWFEETGKPWLLSTTQSSKKRLTTLFVRPSPTSTPVAIIIAPTITPSPTPTFKVVAPVAPTRVFVAPKRRAQESPSPTPTPPVIEDRSTAIRLNVEWPRAIRAFMKNPLLGTGYSSITLATDNDYLRLMGEVGVLGMIAFVLIFVHLWKRISEAMKSFVEKAIITPNRALLAGVVGAAAGLLVNATFIDVFEASKVAPIFWALVGISVGSVKGLLPRGTK